jgi:hypothetical protein
MHAKMGPKIYILSTQQIYEGKIKESPSNNITEKRFSLTQTKARALPVS